MNLHECARCGKDAGNGGRMKDNQLFCKRCADELENHKYEIPEKQSTASNKHYINILTIVKNELTELLESADKYRSIGYWCDPFTTNIHIEYINILLSDIDKFPSDIIQSKIEHAKNWITLHSKDKILKHIAEKAALEKKNSSWKCDKCSHINSNQLSYCAKCKKHVLA